MDPFWWVLMVVVFICWMSTLAVVNAAIKERGNKSHRDSIERKQVLSG